MRFSSQPPTNALDRSRDVLNAIHRRWDTDNDPLRPVAEQNPQRTPTEKAEIDLATATALVSIAESLRNLEYEASKQALERIRSGGRWRG